MNVGEILREYLESNGYDGLYNEGGDCACLTGDLEDNWCMQCNCEPGYIDENSDDPDEVRIVPRRVDGLMRLGGNRDAS